MIAVTIISGVLGTLIGGGGGFFYSNRQKNKMIKKANVLHQNKELFINHTLKSEGSDLPKREEGYINADLQHNPASSHHTNEKEVHIDETNKSS